jgi:hypothetical protein
VGPHHPLFYIVQYSESFHKTKSDLLHRWGFRSYLTGNTVLPRETNRLMLTLMSFFRRDVVEICVLLGYYAALCGNCIPTFRDNVSVPPSRVKRRIREFLKGHVYSIIWGTFMTYKWRVFYVVRYFLTVFWQLLPSLIRCIQQLYHSLWVTCRSSKLVGDSFHCCLGVSMLFVTS